jgi:transposase InsO family protein
MAEPIDHELEKALLRYQIISAYLAMEPTRGQRGPLLEQLAKKTWVGRNGEPYVVTAETIRVWIRRFRRHGLDGLRDKRRPRRGVTALPQELVDLVIKLVRRSTLHRVLKREGISARPTTPAGETDLDRFEADHANDLWQSDLLEGPWLPDPERPGRMRRAHLYAFIDDHSRLLLHGRFSFKGELPHLELVFRRCVQKWGAPRRVYYDNGKVYRSGQMRQVVATLGIHGIVFTQKWRPMGHGKIEALNKFLTSNFIAEVKASTIKTLDELNEAFVAFADVDYNQAIHGETNEAPLTRWKKDVERVRYVDEKLVLVARAAHAGQDRHLLAVRRALPDGGVVREEARRGALRPRAPRRGRCLPRWPLRRAREAVRGEHASAAAHATDSAAAGADGAANGAADGQLALAVDIDLVEQRKKAGFVEETPRALSDEIARERAIGDAAIVSLLEEHVAEDVFDEHAIVEFLARYGPFDDDRARRALESLGDDAPRDLHITHYLDAIRRNHGDKR